MTPGRKGRGHTHSASLQTIAPRASRRQIEGQHLVCRCEGLLANDITSVVCLDCVSAGARRVHRIEFGSERG